MDCSKDPPIWSSLSKCAKVSETITICLGPLDPMSDPTVFFKGFCAVAKVMIIHKII